MPVSQKALRMRAFADQQILRKQEARAAKAWDELSRAAMFPSAGQTAEPARAKSGRLLGDGERSFVSPLDGRAVEKGKL